MWQPWSRTDLMARGARGGVPNMFPALKPLTALSAGVQKFTRHLEPKVYGRVGNLEVRLARTRAEVRLRSACVTKCSTKRCRRCRVA